MLDRTDRAELIEKDDLTIQYTEVDGVARLVVAGRSPARLEEVRNLFEWVEEGVNEEDEEHESKGEIDPEAANALLGVILPMYVESLRDVLPAQVLRAQLALASFVAMPDSAPAHVTLDISDPYAGATVRRVKIDYDGAVTYSGPEDEAAHFFDHLVDATRPSDSEEE